MFRQNAALRLRFVVERGQATQVDTISVGWVGSCGNLGRRRGLVEAWPSSLLSNSFRLRAFSPLPARDGTYMADPKFRPGQMVEFVQSNRMWPQGPYEVVRIMPSETEEPKYRIRSLQEMHERVAWEHELRGIQRG
jgi:hypothetical protein